MNQVLIEKIEGKFPFKIEGDMDAFKQWASQFFDIDEDDEDEGIDFANSHLMEGEEEITPEQREQDIQALKALTEGDMDWDALLSQLPRKKNGTFAKARKLPLWRGESFRHYWEDSYGHNAPEVRIKTMSDDTAVLEWGYWVVNY